MNASDQHASQAPDPGQLVFQLATSYMLGAVLQVAVKLKIANLLAHGPQPVSKLAIATVTNEDALFRALRTLSSVGVFREETPRVFALTPMSELLRSDQPGLYDMVLWITSPFHYRVYSNALHAVRTGEPAVVQATGMPVFEYLPREPELSEIFNNAMTAFSAMVMPAALDAYDFSDIQVLVDVAGGHGGVLTSVLQKHPHMRGVLMDLAHVIEGARPKIAALGLDERCELKVGDFFEAVPSGGDAYIMKHIIHDWDDERAGVILRNVHNALNGRGRVILLEAVIQPGGAPDLGKILDIEMMMMPGGRERSAEEFRALFASAGFEMTRIVPTTSPLSVIEARPA